MRTSATATNDHAERHVLALKLSETGDRRVFTCLIKLIQRPELVNYRGTLVYCRGDFDCSMISDFLELLASDDNFEVAWTAQGILDEQRPK